MPVVTRSALSPDASSGQFGLKPCSSAPPRIRAGVIAGALRIRYTFLDAVSCDTRNSCHDIEAAAINIRSSPARLPVFIGLFLWMQSDFYFGHDVGARIASAQVCQVGTTWSWLSLGGFIYTGEELPLSARLELRAIDAGPARTCIACSPVLPERQWSARSSKVCRLARVQPALPIPAMFKHQPEMGHGQHCSSLRRACPRVSDLLHLLVPGARLDDNLSGMEIEIDPFVPVMPLGAAIARHRTRAQQDHRRKGEVKGGPGSWQKRKGGPAGGEFSALPRSFSPCRHALPSRRPLPTARHDCPEQFDVPARFERLFPPPVFAILSSVSRVSRSASTGDMTRLGRISQAQEWSGSNES